MRIPRVNPLLSAALVLICTAPTWACINTFESEILEAQATNNADHVATVIQRLEQEHSKKATLENSNDLGVARILTGKYDEAIALLRETEQKFPGSAKVAANLGTALDLKGVDDEALQWIREGVKRDANEHQGSEWLHGRILEVKIALEKDPTWLTKNRVLNLDFGTGDIPVAPEILPIENGKLKGVEQLLEQISYQTYERSKFIKPPDAILGDLYASAGDLSLAGGVSVLDGGSSKPDEYYEVALNYGAPRAALVRKRLERYRADLKAHPPVPKPAVADADAVQDYPVVNERFAPKRPRSNAVLIWLGAGTAVTLVLVFVGWLVDRHRRKQAELNPPPPLPDVD